MTQDERKARLAAMHGEAHARFPLAFPPRLDVRRPPLAIGVHVPLAEALGWSAAETGWFLQRWTRNGRYFAGLFAEDHRIGLDGAPAGPIDPAHRAQAREQEAARRAKLRRRREQERAAAATSPTGGAGAPKPAQGSTHTPKPPDPPQRPPEPPESPCGGNLAFTAAGKLTLRRPPQAARA